MQIATNPQTGEKVQWNGSAWVPLGAGGAPMSAPQPVVVGTKRPEKPNIRQVGNQLGVVDDHGGFTPTYTAPPSAASGGPKQIPANAASGIQANIENLRAIDAALAA